MSNVVDELLPPCDVLVDRDTHGPLVKFKDRIGVMLHFDDSSSDQGALQWFRDPAFKLSYNRAYRDDGSRIRITSSIHYAAYHAGVCMLEPGLPVHTLGGTDFRYGGANTGYIGLAVTCGARDTATDAQFDAIVGDTAILFRAAGWTSADVDTRIVGHCEKAIFNPRDNPGQPTKWGKLGRKSDPIGPYANAPVLDIARAKAAVATYLDDPTAPIWYAWSA